MTNAAEEGAAALVAVDWGTTSSRFMLLGENGTLIARREGRGIVPVRDAARQGPATRAGPSRPGDDDGIFAAELRSCIGDWLEANPGIPVLMCGMIGANRGWIEAGYRELPASGLPDRGDLAAVDLPGHPAFIVPGLVQHEPAPDVMRGEETQVLGALAEDGGAAGDALVLTPGTHSKWVRVANGRIESFRTYMTGDVFAALCGHTIIAAEIPDDEGAVGHRSGDAISAAFDHGLDRAMAGDRPSLSRHLFEARSGVLTGRLAPQDVRDVVSGLVIGDEVADAIASLRPSRDVPVLLVATEDLAERYLAALARAGASARRMDGDPTTRGLLAIARHVGLAPPPAEETEHP